MSEESIPQPPCVEGHPCDCEQFLQPLGPDDRLPDHVSAPVMGATVGQWVQEQRYVLDCIGAEIIPDPAPDLVKGHAGPGGWPLPVAGRLLGLIIRQWAWEGGNQTLANQLANDKGWQAEVRTVRDINKLLEMAKRRSPVPLDDLWEERERILAQRLRCRRLPATPPAVAHLRAVAEGSQEPLPARGLLVTTRVYMREGEDPGHFIFHDGDPDVDFSGALEHAPGPLFGQAQAIALQHRDWLRKYAQHPFTVRVNIGKALPTRPQNRTTDYLEEALNATRVQKLVSSLVIRQGHGSNPMAAREEIERYLNVTQGRVRKRLRRAGHAEDTPPPTWREEARHALRPLLNMRLPSHLKLD